MIDVEIPAMVRENGVGAMFIEKNFDEFHDIEKSDRIEAVVGEVAETRNGGSQDSACGFGGSAGGVKFGSYGSDGSQRTPK